MDIKQVFTTPQPYWRIAVQQVVISSLFALLAFLRSWNVGLLIVAAAMGFIAIVDIWIAQDKNTPKEKQDVD